MPENTQPKSNKRSKICKRKLTDLQKSKKKKKNPEEKSVTHVQTLSVSLCQRNMLNKACFRGQFAL